MPDSFVNVEHEGAGGVAGVGDMEFASGKFIDQPSVDGAKAGFTSVGSGFGFGDIFENPRDFCSAEIGVENKPCAFAKDMGRWLEFFATFGGATALPNNSVVKGLAGVHVPNDGGFSLIGNSNGGDISEGIPSHDFGDELLSDLPDFFGIVFNPTRFWVVLSEFGTFGPDHIAIPIEELESDASGSRIDG